MLLFVHYPLPESKDIRSFGGSIDIHLHIEGRDVHRVAAKDFKSQLLSPSHIGLPAQLCALHTVTRNRGHLVAERVGVRGQNAEEDGLQCNVLW